MKETAGGILDTIGRTLLDAIDYRVWILGSLALLAVLAFLNRRKNGAWPGIVPWMLAATGCLMVYSGFTVFCVFVLTKPAYVEALTSDLFGLSAVLTAIATCGLGGREVLKLLKVPELGPESTPAASPGPSRASAPP
jgi:drug/metabolite transporter (DMT)-like permease